MGQRDAIEAVAGIAAGQWGMFTTAQAAGLGVSRAEVARLVSRGVARRLRHGVHIMEGAPSGALEIVRAEWLATDPARTAGDRRGDAGPVVVSHETAARVYEIGDLPSGGVHLTSPGRLRTRQQWVTIHQQALSPKEYQWIEGLPVTTPRRTLEDIATSGRWEASHLRTLAEDALNQGLLPASEIERSAVLVKAVPELAPLARHAAVRQRLANDARQRGLSPQEGYNAFFRMLFMSALDARDGWVLKGGTNVMCRIPQARTTIDLDLFREGDTSALTSAEDLRSLMDGAQVGSYTFRVGTPTVNSSTAEIDVARVRVSVFEAATMVETFQIDISGEVVLNAEPEVVDVPRGDQAVLPGYPATVKVRLYPIENQIADKLCAMYATYGAGRPSTRYRDLYDLALILDNLPFDREILSAALTTQQGLRHVTIPEDFGEPAPGWAADYDKQMGRTPSAREPFTTYAAAMASLRTALNPAF